MLDKSKQAEFAGMISLKKSRILFYLIIAVLLIVVFTFHFHLLKQKEESKSTSDLSELFCRNMLNNVTSVNNNNDKEKSWQTVGCEIHQYDKE